MSVTGLVQRVSSFVAALFASACCASLPRMAQRHAEPLPTTSSVVQFSESLAVWHDQKRNRDVPVKLYVPTTKEPSPVVVFSHGIGEDRESYAYFGRALASAGFLTVHITHAGTDRAVLERGYRHLYRAVKEKQNWIDRVIDISYALDQLAKDPRADLERVAVAGHSAGAFTAFAVAGLRTADGNTLRDPRVKAIVPMSMPRMDDVVPDGGYDGITIPVLNVTGSCDASLIYRTLPRHRRIPFEQTRATGHHLVTIRDVNHDAFSAARNARHELLTDLTIAFLRGVLLGDRPAAAWFREPGLIVVNGSELTIETK